MNKNLFPLCLLLALLGVGLMGCNDDTNIGNTLAKGETSIEVDSSFSVKGISLRTAEFDSRSSDLLLGRLDAEGFGSLDCGYVSQLMPAGGLSVPDSISLDMITGMKMKFTYTKTGLTGDSLSPQQLTVYKLTRQIPSDINNLTDLAGYFDSSKPIGVKTFTASSLGLSSKLWDKKEGVVSIDLDPEWSRELVSAYRTNPEMFAWPQDFARNYPGIYVRSTFGRGLVVNMSGTQFTTYWQVKRQITVVEDGKSVKKDSLFTDSISLLSVSPEVLSANLLRLTPAPSVDAAVAKGKCLLQSPGGYDVNVTFPAQAILDAYSAKISNLQVVNSLTFSIPASAVPNEYGISYPPYLLMIKRSRMKDFFLNRELPEEDDKDVFYAAYDSSTGCYTFKEMRPYIVDLLTRGQAQESDLDFMLVPVSITTETVGSYGNTKTVVTSCSLYMEKPTLTLLDIEGSKVKFTYSKQLIK